MLRKCILFGVTFLLLFAVTSFTSTAFAASAISVTPTGDTTYSIQGSGMDGVAGIQLDISYDSASLTNPTVTQGALVSGAMLAANTGRPGLIKIAIISSQTFSASGQIAGLSFASRSGTGGITSISANLINNKGATVASTATFQAVESSPTASSPQPVTVQQTQSTPTASSASTTPATVTTPTYPGTVSLPSDQQQGDVQTAKAADTPVNTGQSAVPITPETAVPQAKPAVEAKPEESRQVVVYKSVAERFKQAPASKTLTAMSALFDKKVAQFITQEPPVLLSDGQKTAVLTINLTARINASPGFAVSNGTLISFKQDKMTKGRWLVEILPEAGTTKAILTIIAGSDEFEFPLTVAPVMKTTLTRDERGWGKFLQETGSPQAPIYDLNGDGTRDYIDEYIFVANYLAEDKPAPVTLPDTPAKKSRKK